MNYLESPQFQSEVFSIGYRAQKKRETWKFIDSIQWSSKTNYLECSSGIEISIERNCSAEPSGKSGFAFVASKILSRSSSLGIMLRSFSMPSRVTMVESIFRIAVRIDLFDEWMGLFFECTTKFHSGATYRPGGSFVIEMLIALERFASSTIISLFLVRSVCLCDLCRRWCEKEEMRKLKIQF